MTARPSGLRPLLWPRGLAAAGPLRLFEDDDMDDETRERFDTLDRQLQAIVTGLDEQDVGHERLMGKVDRLSVLSRAGEEAVTSLDALSRRVTKLETALRDRT